MATAPDLQTPWSATDVWSGLDHKQGMGASINRPGSWLAPTWIGAHARRLTAYKILEDYYKNKARVWLPTENEDEKAEHRELGDAALIVEAQVSALVGEEQSIVVDAVSDSEADMAAAEEVQAWFDDWAIRERFRSKVKHVERSAVKLGDGIYVLEADTRRKRVRLRVLDPGFYFPELAEDISEDDFPTTVHLAWQFERVVDSGDFFVRRVTFRLGAIMPKRADDGLFIVDDDGPILFDGDTLDLQRGTIVRTLPWSDEPTDVTCFMSNGVWKLEDVEGYTVENFPTQFAVWESTPEGQIIRDLDLRYDFIPVIHVPNTVEILDHYGMAAVTPIAQTLDELAAADTDAAKAAALAGVPAVVVKGVGVRNLRIKPGAVIPIGEDGDFEVIDLSPALVAISNYVVAMQKRTSENARVPDEWLGRVKSSEVNSGFQLAMGFAPLRSLVDGEMRLTREEKYPLLLKFVQRISILFGWLEGDVQEARVMFGSFLPSDEASVIDTTTKLFKDHLISRETAISMLVEAGIIDVDVADEVEAAESEDFAAALALADATGEDLDAVYELLHRDKPEVDETKPEVEPVLSTAVPPIVVDEDE